MEAKVQRRNDTAATEKAMSRLLAGAIIVLVVLSALGGILTVGDHLMGASPVLGGIFYAAIAILLIVGIGYPVVQISKRPVFGLYQLEQGSERQRDACRQHVGNGAAYRGAAGTCGKRPGQP